MEAERQSQAEHASGPADSRISADQLRDNADANRQSDGAGNDARGQPDRTGKFSEICTLGTRSMPFMLNFLTCAIL